MIFLVVALAIRALMIVSDQPKYLEVEITKGSTNLDS
jgi:hypothetical protein